MDIDQNGQHKRVRFSIHHSDKDGQIDDKAEARAKLDGICNNNGSNDMVIGIPVNNWGTHVMGDPAHPCANPKNQVAATWTAPEPMQQPQLHAESPTEERTESNSPTTPLELHGSPMVQSGGPYVLDGPGGSRHASNASGKCKFLPHPKFLPLSSFLCATIDGVINRFNKWGKNAEVFIENFFIHMKLGGSMPQTVWAKLSLGAKILTEGGLQNVFKLAFSVGPREKLLKTSACYLSTTTGPVAGLLFISTQKVAFCSDRPLSYATPEGKTAWSPYRVAIPIGRLKSVSPCENIDRPAQKYIRVDTLDNYEFWFMGFVNYQKALRYLREAVRVH